MTILVKKITSAEVKKLLFLQEGHFADAKSKRIKPADLTKTMSAFANADGGEIYIGLEDHPGQMLWDGFANQEEANGHIQAFEELFPLGNYFSYEFFQNDSQKGLLLKCEISKTPDIRAASDGKIYLRRGAQKIPQNSEQQRRRIEFNKGLFSYEDERLKDSLEAFENSETFNRLLGEVVPKSDPIVWLKKQRLVVDELPTVAATILLNDEPQAVLPKSAVKIYRYKTDKSEGSRDVLDFTPITIEGSAFFIIERAVEKTIEIAEKIPALGSLGFEKISYPREAVHETITNAVIHRDYSIKDDIHVRIFNNRIEIESPGTLAGHVTVDNILDERFARNPKIVRILNKFPDAPNKDIGEGLNTTFQAMRKLKLKDQIITQRQNSVLVKLYHEPLATYEEIIMKYLNENSRVNNSVAREICREGSENKMKRTFEKMMKSGLIERIPGLNGPAIAYRLKMQVSPT